MRRLSVFSSLLVAAVAACSHFQRLPTRTLAIQQQGAPLVMHGRVTDHVIVISVDGLRADAIHKFHAPTIERLMR